MGPFQGLHAEDLGAYVYHLCAFPMGIEQLCRRVYTCGLVSPLRAELQSRGFPPQRQFSLFIRSWQPARLRQHLYAEAPSKSCFRGAKTRTTLKVKDLPQGALPASLPDLIDEDDGPAYPTVVQQARNNMKKFDHCVVLTRVGNFYEVRCAC